MTETEIHPFPFARIAAIYGAPLVFLLILLIPSLPGIPPLAQKALAVATWMLIWWISEAVQLSVTALLPLILFPVLGILPLERVSSNYGDKVIFLFMGGFMIALAMEKWKLHLRIAMNIVRLTGTNANGIILGFMLSTAFLSMWISNTATTVMMFPIALSVVNVIAVSVDRESKGFKNFALCLMLTIAYASNIGGIATLVGTPPNTVLRTIISKTYGYEITFARWFGVGFPFAFILLFSSYFILTRFLFPNRLTQFKGTMDVIQEELKKLGKMGRGEILTLIIFVITASLWIFREAINLALPVKLDDTVIAIIAAVSLFVMPVHLRSKTFLLKWEDTEKLPWGILLLFGGGLALADALNETGIIRMLAGSVAGYGSYSLFWMLLLLATLSIFVTEIMSNVALVTVFVPVVSAIAVGLGENPLIFAIPVTIGASCAFMLPMATPPNAIVFASGLIKIPHMARAGFTLNLISILVIMLLSNTLMFYLFDISPGVLPEWVKINK